MTYLEIIDEMPLSSEARTMLLPKEEFAIRQNFITEIRDKI
jgi:hypothetical protein